MLAAIQAAARQLPVNMPSPPTLRKVNPADAPIFFLAMQSDSMPLYELDKYAENLLARQLSTLTGVAQVNVQGAAAYRGAAAGGSQRAGGAQYRHRPGGQPRCRPPMSMPPPAQLNGPSQATLVHVNGQLTNAAQWNKQIIAWRNGAPVRFAGYRPRHRQSYQNNLCRDLVQRQARHRAVDPAPARLQHHPDRGRDQPGASRASSQTPAEIGEPDRDL